jgi:hypothetical protein
MKHAEIFTRLAQRADPNIPILEAAMDEIAALEAENKRLTEKNVFLVQQTVLNHDTIAQQAETLKLAEGALDYLLYSACAEPSISLAYRKCEEALAAIRKEKE